MPNSSRDASNRENRLGQKVAFLATVACIGLTPVDSAAQYPSSLLATFGFGEVPEEHRYGSYAASVALFWRLSPMAHLGIEGGYQRFGTHPQHDIIGLCPIPPVGPCEGRITAERRSRGDLWFVGPNLHLRLHEGALRPLAVFGLGRYVSGEHTTTTYSDDRGEPVSYPPPVVFDRTFRGIGINGGLGLQGSAIGRFQWAVLARAHGAIGGMSGEFASVSAYTVTAGFTLLFGADRSASSATGRLPTVSLRSRSQVGTGASGRWMQVSFIPAP